MRVLLILKYFVELFKAACILNKTMTQLLMSFNIVRKYCSVISAVWFIISELSSVWEWYTVDSSDFVFNYSKIFFHMSVTNLRSLSVRIVLDKSQFIKVRWLRNLITYCISFHVILSEIKFTALLNLSVIDIRQSYFFSKDIISKPKMKFNEIIWNDHEDISID